MVADIDKSLKSLDDGDETLLALYRSKLPNIGAARFNVKYSQANATYSLYKAGIYKPVVVRVAEDVRAWTDPAKVWKFLADNWEKNLPNPRAPGPVKKESS